LLSALDTLDETSHVSFSESRQKLATLTIRYRRKCLSAIGRLAHRQPNRQTGKDTKKAEGKIAGVDGEVGEIDQSAYVRAITLRTVIGLSDKQLETVLTRQPDTESGIRRLHKGQHLYLHAGDWHRWLQTRQDLAGKAVADAIGENDDPKVIAARAALIRAENEANPKRRRK
jgi:hypothetical protein